MTQPLPRTYQEPVWTDDLDPSGRETQSDLESLEQDVLHIIGEKLGSNMADKQKGAAALSYLNGNADDLAALPHVIDAQLAQVARISASHSTLTLQDDGTYRLDIEVAVAGVVVGLQYTLGPNGVQSASP
jgi:hypothetical protein